MTSTSLHDHGIDPFKKSTTIASACQFVYRDLFLQPDTISIIPPGHYAPTAAHSEFSQKWLHWLQHNRKIQIQFACTSGKKCIYGKKVDGYHKDLQNDAETIFEAYGCFWHGCPSCYSRDTVNPICNRSMYELYDQTVKREILLKSGGYKVETIWECSFQNEVKENKELRDFVTSLKLVKPINPRDSFYGGRTNAFTLYHHVSSNEKIHYSDFCSLYPYICKYSPYPVGHPEVISSFN